MTAGQLAEALASRNRGLSADMIRVQTNERGWLTEVRICLGTELPAAPLPEPCARRSATVSHFDLAGELG